MDCSLFFLSFFRVLPWYCKFSSTIYILKWFVSCWITCCFDAKYLLIFNFEIINTKLLFLQILLNDQCSVTIIYQPNCNITNYSNRLVFYSLCNWKQIRSIIKYLFFLLSTLIVFEEMEIITLNFCIYRSYIAVLFSHKWNFSCELHTKWVFIL